MAKLMRKHIRYFMGLSDKFCQIENILSFLPNTWKTVTTLYAHYKAKCKVVVTFNHVSEQG